MSTEVVVIILLAFVAGLITGLFLNKKKHSIIKEQRGGGSVEEPKNGNEQQII